MDDMGKKKKEGKKREKRGKKEGKKKACASCDTSPQAKTGRFSLHAIHQLHMLSLANGLKHELPGVASKTTYPRLEWVLVAGDSTSQTVQGSPYHILAYSALRHICVRYDISRNIYPAFTSVWASNNGGKNTSSEN